MAKTEKEIVQIILNQLNDMKVNKQNHDGVNQTIAELMRPNDANFNKSISAGAREDQEIADTTAARANTTLASILQSQITTPGEKWAILHPSNRKEEEDESVKRFYEELSDEVYNVTKDTDSQFYQKNHEFFLDFPVFGTGAMFINEDEDDNIIFELRKLQEIYCEQNNKGIIDTLYREFKFTARQAAQEFGEDNLGKEVRMSLAKKPSEKTVYVHAIMPIIDYLRMTGGVPKKFNPRHFKSVYVSVEDKKIVREGFFEEQPFAAARWSKRIGEVYGYGAAWDVLSDIEVLNILSMLELEALQLVVRPPLIATDEGALGSDVEWIPGGITYGAMTEDGRRLVDSFNLGINVSDTFATKEERIKNIEAAFFVDQFREREGVQPLTAVEALQNEEKRLSLLSPQIKRIEDEYLTPVIRRLVAIILRRRKIEIPEVLSGIEIDYDIEYIAPLSFTRRTSELSRYNRFIQNAAPFLQIHPTGSDNFKLDEIIRTIAEKSGIPLKEMKLIEEVEAGRQAVQEEKQRQQQLLDIEAGAGAVEKIAKSGVLDE